MRPNLETAIVAIAAAIMGVACSTRQVDSTGPDVTGDRLGSPALKGSWVHTAIGPLYRESMTLSQVGTHVAGTGTYAIEAGRSGPTTIDGMVSGRTLTLTITRDYGLVETFTGRLTDATHLTGTLAIAGSAQGFAYAKQ
jgi:hypothetical protein